MGVVVERENGYQMVESEGRVEKLRLLFTVHFHYFSFQQVLESDEILKPSCWDAMQCR